MGYYLALFPAVAVAEAMVHSSVANPQNIMLLSFWAIVHILWFEPQLLWTRSVYLVLQDAPSRWIEFAFGVSIFGVPVGFIATAWLEYLALQENSTLMIFFQVLGLLLVSVCVYCAGITATALLKNGRLMEKMFVADVVRTTFLILGFPLGIWWLQPKVRRML